MSHLYQVLEQRVRTWRKSGYSTDNYPAIAEILDYGRLEDGGLRFSETGQNACYRAGQIISYLNNA